MARYVLSKCVFVCVNDKHNYDSPIHGCFKIVLRADKTCLCFTVMHTVARARWHTHMRAHTEKDKRDGLFDL